MMKDTLFPPTPEFTQNAKLDTDGYHALYQQSIESPDNFWRVHGKRLHWFTPYTKVKNTSFQKGNIQIKWFEDGELNASYNCLDRHLETHADKIAIIWEGDDASHQQTITYRQLHERVCQFANVLLSKGVTKGEVVTIYMPMVPEVIIAMLACARIGAPHSVIFAGFSPDAIASRVKDGNSKVIITADEGVRGGRTIPLKANVDHAIEQLNEGQIETVIVYQHTGNSAIWVENRDICWQEACSEVSQSHQAQVMNAEDPLFLLYTSGSTGQPKGVLHTTGGYLVYTSMTHEYVFDYKQDDIHWCTADVGWITGHSFMVYGPLSNGATVVMHEGIPNYPIAARIGEMIDRHKVTVLYTAPTLIRALMAKGAESFNDYQGDSLRLMGTAGEPINPQAWLWYHEVIGKQRCPIVDTWWQTETGAPMITPLPGATATKPGAATLPFFGIKPELVDHEGKIIEGAGEGNLVFTDSWPSQMRTVYGNHQRFEETYFSTFENHYFSGDGARRDEDGYLWITGRVDDVLNVSGHRLGTAEVESALVSHTTVAEAAIVGYPHNIKGQGIYAFVTLTEKTEPTDELKHNLTQWVRQHLGALASLDAIQWAPELPKTRSGKIMRRFLRKIAANDYDNFGDTTTLAEPAVVERLITNRISPPHCD